MGYKSTVSDIVRAWKMLGQGSCSSADSECFRVSLVRVPAPSVGPAPTRSFAATSVALILLGLEVLIIADIVRTIIVQTRPTQSVVILGVCIVVVRILLSFALRSR